MHKKSIQCPLVAILGILLAFFLYGCTTQSGVSPSNSAPYVTSESNELHTLENTELPWIKTKTVLWQELNCLIPASFETVTNGSSALMAADATSKFDSDLGYIVYHICPESELEGWNSNPFSEKHIQLLIKLMGEDETENASKAVRVDKSYSRQLGEDVVCYHLFLEDAESSMAWYCISKFSLDDSNSLVLAGVASNSEGALLFDRLVETAAAVDHSADLTGFIPKVTITRFDQTDRSPLLYGVHETGDVYVQIEDDGISRDISNYTLFGQSFDGKITLYVSKTDDTFMLVDDPDYREAVLTAKSTSSYFTQAED